MIDNKTLAITLVRGDSFTIPISNYKEGVKIPFPPNSVIHFGVKKRSKDSVYAFCKRAVIREDGTAIIQINPQDTENLATGSYRYDIEYSNTERSIVRTWVNNKPFKIVVDIVDRVC